jgi:hypothetical protein
MKSSIPKSILITQGELVNYAGSEVTTLELAEYFSDKASHVHILSSYISLPIEKDFQNLSNVILHTNSSEINFKDLDLIWIHHQFIPKEIIDLSEVGKLRAKVVFYHMSSFIPLEFPFAVKIEEYLADLILFNSYLTKDTIERKLKNLNFKGDVFNNPAPDKYLIPIEQRKFRRKLKNVLVVSNHPPEEILETAQLLEQQGINVRIIGASTHQEYRRIKPKDIAWADVVISIGKTVQYAIQSAAPVFCYDHFGGPGYLNESNFVKAAKMGFSGKGFNLKSAANIANELIQNYPASQLFSKHLHKTASSEYLLSYKVSDVLKTLQNTRVDNRKKLLGSDKEAFIALNAQLWSIHSNLRRIQQAHGRLNELYSSLSEKSSRIIQAQEDEINAQGKQLRDIISSKSWKITKPLRQANKKINQRKFK